MGTLSAIVDVTKNMQLVDGQSLDDITDGDDEVVSTTCRDDGIHDTTDIGSLVYIVCPFKHQFFDDVVEFRRQGLANLRTGIFR